MGLDEKVLCVPRDIVKDKLNCRNTSLPDRGFVRSHWMLRWEELRLCEPQFIRREECEQDPAWKQIIPYIIVTHYDDKQPLASGLSYQRSSGGGESRLFGKRSVGIGGHIKDTDGVGADEAFIRGFFRELYEEIDISPRYSWHQVGLLNDDTDEVGEVHLGLVMEVCTSSLLINSKEDDIVDPQFSQWGAIQQASEADPDLFEGWSKILLEKYAPSERWYAMK